MRKLPILSMPPLRLPTSCAWRNGSSTARIRRASRSPSSSGGFSRRIVWCAADSRLAGNALRFKTSSARCSISMRRRPTWCPGRLACRFVASSAAAIAPTSNSMAATSASMSAGAPRTSCHGRSPTGWQGTDGRSGRASVSTDETMTRQCHQRAPRMRRSSSRAAILAATALATAACLVGGCRPGAPAGPDRGGAGPESVAVVTMPVQQKPIAVKVEALGTARAAEAIDVTSKTANKVIAVRFDEGQWVRRGELLIELDGAQDRADLAAAEAALAESRSAYERSRGLYTQQAVSQSQLEQIEATLKGNQARVAAAEARVADTVIRGPFGGRIGLRRGGVGAPRRP